MEPTIRFRVRNQQISRTDTFHVVAGSRNYLSAEFEFLTPDWDGVMKTAIFKTESESYNILLDGDVCRVPWEVLASPGILSVSVFGGDLITVNHAEVRVHESGYAEGEAPGEPTPDVYAQVLSMVGEARDDADKAQASAAASESAAKEAEASAKNAESSAAASQASAAGAQASATGAQASAANAESSASASQMSAESSETLAAEAQAAAAAAQSSAEAAEALAAAAASAAAEAAPFAAAAQASAEEAETAKNAAVESATEAQTAQSAAAESASGAEAAKNAATESQSSAASSATAAESAKNAAAASAEIARASETSAASAAVSAQEAKTQSEQIKSDVQKISDTVDDKVASVVAMKGDFVTKHAIYDELCDSAGDTMLDSDGDVIVGSVIFADMDYIVYLIKRIEALETALKYASAQPVDDDRIAACEASIERLEAHALLDNDFGGD